MSNHLLSIVFRLHYHSQKVIGSLGNSKFAPENRPSKQERIVFQPSIFRFLAVSFGEGRSIQAWSIKVSRSSTLEKKSDVASQRTPPLIRPAVKPLFLGGGTLGGVGWLAMNAMFERGWGSFFVLGIFFLDDPLEIKTLVTFHFTGWLIGILITACHNPYINGYSSITS